MVKNNELKHNNNAIEIKDPFAVVRHLNHLIRIGLHCFVSTPGHPEMNGRFTSIANDRLIINLLTSSEGEPEIDSVVEVKYTFDNILHSFQSCFKGRQGDDLLLVFPSSVLRYQIRRFKRVVVPEGKDLGVQFNLMPQKSTVRDISIGGIGIHLNSLPDNIGKNIRLKSIKLMLKQNQTLHLSGILRYIRSIDDPNKQFFRIGVEFDPLKEDDKSTLLDYLDDLEY